MIISYLIYQKGHRVVMLEGFNLLSYYPTSFTGMQRIPQSEVNPEELKNKCNFKIIFRPSVKPQNLVTVWTSRIIDVYFWIKLMEGISESDLVTKNLTLDDMKDIEFSVYNTVSEKSLTYEEIQSIVEKEINNSTQKS